MKLLEFLKNISGKDNLLEVFTDNIEVRDYFLNVVPILFELNVTVNNKNIFGAYQTNYYNQVLIIDYSHKLPQQPKQLFKIKNDEVIDATEDDVKKEQNFNIIEPINFFKLLTI